MKFKTLLKAVALGAALLTTPAFAQGAMKLKMDVPYVFQAGHVQLPPGTYVITCAMGSNILWLYNEGTRKTVAVLTDVSEPRSANQSVALFHVYNDKHYLANLWCGLNYTGRQLIPSNAENEAKASGPRKIALLKVQQL